MDTSAYIGIGILALVIAPFLIGYLKRKKNKENLVKEFIKTGFKYGIEISQTDTWKNRLIGYDSIKKKLLFSFRSDEYIEVLIPLSEVISAEIRTSYLNNFEKVIDKIQLEIKFKTGKNETSIENFNFYDSENDGTIDFELILANKWREIILNSK